MLSHNNCFLKSFNFLFCCSLSGRKKKKRKETTNCLFCSFWGFFPASPLFLQFWITHSFMDGIFAVLSLLLLFVHSFFLNFIFYFSINRLLVFDITDFCSECLAKRITDGKLSFVFIGQSKIQCQLSNSL